MFCLSLYAFLGMDYQETFVGFIFLNITRLGKGAKKNPKCKLFPKGGEGVNPKVYILKSLYTVKRGFKMDFFHTRMCFSKFGEQQKKFWDTNIFFEIFVKKFTFQRGGGSTPI